MSQINVRNLSNENEDGAPDIVGISTLSATSYFVPPVGTTAQRPENPQPGDLRFNTDSASLEYFRGDTLGWSQIEMTSPDLNGGARGVKFGGEDNPAGTGTNVIQYITISTLGNATDFGDLTVKRGTTGACASRTRGLCMSGYWGGYNNHIDYVTISSTGNALDFGDLPVAVQGVDVLSSATRGVITSGSEGTAPGYGISNVLSYVTIASTGNTQDYGDLSRNTSYGATCASSTRGIFAGGYNPYNTYANNIDYITIATTGNSQNFADLTSTFTWCCGLSNSTRGIIAGGRGASGGAVLNNIQYITIATTGDATNFGDLTVARLLRSSDMASPTRGVYGGGNATPVKQDVMDYIQIASTGDAVDFGNLTEALAAVAGASNAHGGL